MAEMLLQRSLSNLSIADDDNSMGSMSRTVRIRPWISGTVTSFVNSETLRSISTQIKDISGKAHKVTSSVSAIWLPQQDQQVWVALCKKVTKLNASYRVKGGMSVILLPANKRPTSNARGGRHSKRSLKQNKHVALDLVTSSVDLARSFC